MKAIILLVVSTFTLSLLQAQSPLKPNEEQALVQIFVCDFDKVAEEGAIIHLVSPDGKIKHKGVSDVNGEYELLLPEGESFQVNVEKFGADFDFGVFEVPAAKGAIHFKHTFQIAVVEKYVRNYTLENVHFDSGSFEIKKESEKALKELLGALQSNPKMRIEIAGHTDNIGEDKANMKLSQQRADAILKWLVKNSISAQRLLAKGYGEVHPIADNDTEKGRQKNRRTEVKVIEE